ncbi:murein DD-endopeptidase MepM/ murein hydrolase activator NlpD [Halopolyspora algeriensis]|uniref:Murein DD-endopeptidase MepM/ murein hydrolase activator NlpD n=1 Tax=Halopolyspora algeriensis TaxID=1500506 RepID=A0A368VXG1_9ACTN|nr:murein DD-endopeptidase MepM/ murein hydrolase activator NlpD [Halopolyspora algeriensis]TQM46692.1 murein DD-endopeptidase MepM/ murein hydrolase activator NlpD [Halopolyspora algeriensis]
MVAAVAAGAFAAAGQAMAAEEEQADTGHDEYAPLASGQNAAASFGSVADASDTASAGDTAKSANGVGGAAPAPQVLPVAKPSESDAEVRQLAKSERIAKERAAAEAARQAALREARQPDYVAPAEGRFTSGYGGRWGTTHYGIDIANSTGTPIKAVAEGTVIEAGSASGFGLWVRILHDDGTVTVYGHINTITVNEGERVEAGDQIATMGNRGFSTGTHLHFEVWNTSGKKINPVPWLREHGVDVT